jgi:hypothetical protein
LTPSLLKHIIVAQYMIELFTPLLLLVFTGYQGDGIFRKDFAEFVKNYPRIERKIELLKSENSEKIVAFNVKSGKFIGNVSKNAADNSPALIPVGPTVFLPSPTPTPSVILGLPTHTVTPTPVYVPITEMPLPTPHRCKEQLCPMIACIDIHGVQSSRMIIEECPCPCVPPPIY